MESQNVAMQVVAAPGDGQAGERHFRRCHGWYNGWHGRRLYGWHDRSYGARHIGWHDRQRAAPSDELFER